jgi:ElaB/YqjD/DUF883 family membrane-anchored ribosome-binding protein
MALKHVDDYKRAAEGLKEDLRQTAAEGRTRVEEGVKQAAATARAQADEISRMVRQRPLQSLAIAAGVGALLGLILGGKHRR